MTVDPHARIRDAIDRIAQGGMVIVTDHEGREDEGDLIAGVLTRPGHTEPAHDLAALAGLPAAGVLSKPVNDDGTMMRGTRLEAFAKAHNLLRISIDELAAFRAAQRSGLAA